MIGLGAAVAFAVMLGQVIAGLNSIVAALPAF
jgi:hypothetical protein